MAKGFLDDSEMKPDEMVVLKIITGHNTAVIQHETNWQTPQELHQHAQLAAAANLEELTTWKRHSYFRRQ